MKNKILLIVIVGVVFWFVSRETMMDKLMDVQFPIVAKQESGIQFYDPEPGSTVDVADQLERGLVTMVYFYNDNCRGCQIFDTNLNKLVKLRPDIAVTKMPVGKVGYKVRYMGEKLNAKNLPFIMIFDKNEKLLVSDNGDEHEAYTTFYEWLQEEVDRKNTQLKEEWLQSKQS